MDTDLVLSPGVEREFRKRMPLSATAHFVARDGQFALAGLVGRKHLVLRCLCEIASYLAASLRQLAVEKGYVFALEHHIVPVVLQRFLGLDVFRKHHQPRSVAVKTVDDEYLVGRMLRLDIVSQDAVGGLHIALLR